MFLLHVQTVSSLFFTILFIFSETNVYMQFYISDRVDQSNWYKTR